MHGFSLKMAILLLALEFYNGFRLELTYGNLRQNIKSIITPVHGLLLYCCHLLQKLLLLSSNRKIKKLSKTVLGLHRVLELTKLTMDKRLEEAVMSHIFVHLI